MLPGLHGCQAQGGTAGRLHPPPHASRALLQGPLWCRQRLATTAPNLARPNPRPGARLTPPPLGSRISDLGFPAARRAVQPHFFCPLQFRISLWSRSPVVLWSLHFSFSAFPHFSVWLFCVCLFIRCWRVSKVRTDAGTATLNASTLTRLTTRAMRVRVVTRMRNPPSKSHCRPLPTRANLRHQTTTNEITTTNNN